MQHLGKNVVFVLALVAAGFLIAWLRFRPYLEGAGDYSDGQQTYDVSEGTAVRHAIWDPAFEWEGEVNTREDERSPTISPDGRYLVFGVGELAGDLWICELDEGRPRNARPISDLNSASGEIAPAFSEAYLYFASDRPGTAGGFDLWRAPYAEGDFGPAERLAGGVNTAADECDPAPIGGDAALAFASNRGADEGLKLDFDLYRANFGKRGQAVVTPLSSLNTKANERDPASTSDGSALFFASDREGTFDLYRSAYAQGADGFDFLAPRRLTGLATEAAERDPAPSQGGFSLSFSSQEPGSDSDLLRANSRELFRRPGRPVGWMELVVLAALLLLALLAKLSVRWSGLEVLYKCVLVSLLAHLLLLWWFRNIYPESEPVEFEPDGPRIRVHLMADPTSNVAQNVEHGGRFNTERERSSESELERAVLSQEAAPRAQAPEVEVQVAAAQEAPAPQRRESEAERMQGEIPVADVRLGSQAVSLRNAEAPELVSELAPVGSRPRLAEGAILDRRSGSSVNAPESAPGREKLARQVRTEVEFGRQPGRGAAEFSRAEPVRQPAAELRGPVALPESNLSRSAKLADLDLGSASRFVPDRSVAGEQLEPRASGRVLDSSELAPQFGGLTRSSKSSEFLRAPERPKFQSSPERSGASELAVELAAEQRESAPQESPPSAGMETLEAASFARAEPRAELESGPAPFVRKPAAAALAPEFKPLAIAVPVRRDQAPAKGERWDHTPYQARSGGAKLRALEEHGGTVETERAVAAGLAYLAEHQRSGGNWGRTHWREQKYLETTVGKTGLSLLAFLGAGHTQRSETEYSGVVEDAIRFLLAEQDPGSGHFGFSSSYSHAIATYALAECFALTQDERLRAPLARAASQITRHQVKSRDARLDGGWGYYYPDDRSFDRWSRASVTVWQVMALESARLGGLAVEDEVFARAKRFLLGCWDRRRGAFLYSHDPERLSSGYPVLPGSTPASLFALSILGVDVSQREFGPARTFVLERKPRRFAPRSNDAFVERAEGNLYFWYYSTLSLFRAGGTAWEEWNGAMKSTLLDSQAENGSWASESPYSQDYAGDTNRDRCYSTAMCVLSLEVYYRYFTPLLKVE